MDAKKEGKIRHFVLSVAIINRVVLNLKEMENTHVKDKFNSPTELTTILIWSGQL